MLHRKCGGSFIKLQTRPEKVVYQCNTCGKVLTMYRRLPPVAIQKDGKDY